MEARKKKNINIFKVIRENSFSLELYTQKIFILNKKSKIKTFLETLSWRVYHLQNH